MKNDKEQIRIDTWLWAVRMFKSRSLASEAIKGGKVKLNERNIKPSHVAKIGETYHITISSQVKKIIEVSGLIDRRGNSETARKNYIDHSPPVEKTSKEDKAFFTMNVTLEKGSGRPTKKDRRKLNKEGGWF